jgi:hypothetical protein
MGHAGSILVFGFHQADPRTGIESEMTRSKQDPGVTPHALTSAGSSGSAPRSPNPSADRQAATLAIGLGVLVHMLRSRRLYERAAFAAIVLAALAGLAGLDHESRAKARARLRAWITGQNQRLEHKVG